MNYYISQEKCNFLGDIPGLSSNVHSCLNLWINLLSPALFNPSSCLEFFLCRMIRHHSSLLCNSSQNSKVLSQKIHLSTAVISAPSHITVCTLIQLYADFKHYMKVLKEPLFNANFDSDPACWLTQLFSDGLPDESIVNTFLNILRRTGVNRFIDEGSGTVQCS